MTDVDDYDNFGDLLRKKYVEEVGKVVRERLDSIERFDAMADETKAFIQFDTSHKDMWEDLNKLTGRFAFEVDQIYNEGLVECIVPEDNDWYIEVKRVDRRTQDCDLPVEVKSIDE